MMLIKANKHAIIAARKLLVARNVKSYADYKKKKDAGLTTLRFHQWLKDD